MSITVCLAEIIQGLTAKVFIGNDFHRGPEEDIRRCKETIWGNNIRETGVALDAWEWEWDVRGGCMGAWVHGGRLTGQ